MKTAHVNITNDTETIVALIGEDPREGAIYMLDANRETEDCLDPWHLRITIGGRVLDGGEHWPDEIPCVWSPGKIGDWMARFDGGFWGWAWDSRDVTREAIDDDDLVWLAEDIVYGMKNTLDAVLYGEPVAAVLAWLDDERERLLGDYHIMREEGLWS